MAKPPEQFSQLGQIVGCLERIRRRLLIVRLCERATLALLCAAPVVLCLTLARFVHQRSLMNATFLALIPGVVSAGLLWRARRLGGGLSTDARLALGLAGGLSLAGAVLLYTPMGAALSFWHAPAAVAGLFLAAAVATLPRITPQATAVFVDRHAGLEERVATAYEWAHRSADAGPLEEAFRTPLLESAAAACQRVQVAKVGYARLDRRMYVVTGTLVCAALATMWLQPLPALGRAGQRNGLVVKQARNLAAVLEALEKQQQKADKDPALAAAAEPLRNAVRELRNKNDMSNLEALDHLKTAREGLQEIKERQEANNDALKSLGGDDVSNRIASAVQQIQKARSMESQGDPGASEAKAQAEQALKDAAQEAANKLAGGQMPASEKQKLGAALKNAAAKAGGKADGKNGGGDKQLERSLAEAAESLDKGDSQQLSQHLQDAGNRMADQTSQRTLNGEKLEEAMRRVSEMQNELGGSPQMAGGEQGNGEQPSGQQDGQAGGAQQAGSGQQRSGQQGGGQEGGGQQAGAGQQAEADQQGGGHEGAGEGQQAGTGSDGQGGKESGGSTEWAAPGGPGGKTHDRTVGREGTKVRIYGMREVVTKGSTEKVQGPLGAGPTVGSQDVVGPADKNDGTLVDYTQQLPAARKLMEDQMNNQRIPPQYHDLIRSFYDDAR